MAEKSGSIGASNSGTAWRVVSLVCAVLLAFCGFIVAWDLGSYLLKPETYHFGTEVHGLRYAGPASFVCYSLTMVGIAAFGLTAPFFRVIPKKGAVVIRITSVVLLLALI